MGSLCCTFLQDMVYAGYWLQFWVKGNLDWTKEDLMHHALAR